MKKLLPSLVLGTMTILTGGAMAQTPPTATAAAPALYQVVGFRSARFGMSAAELRVAIARDFSPAADAVSEFENPAERTQVITVKLASLEPGPGAAFISYILGAKSKRLMHMNISWNSSPTPTPAERESIAAAGLQLANYFRSQRWKPNGAAAGIPDGPNGLLMFAGVDTKDSAVEVRVSGLQVVGPAGTTTALPPTGPAQLTLAYIANVRQPDIATIPPGAF